MMFHSDRLFSVLVARRKDSMRFSGFMKGSFMSGQSFTLTIVKVLVMIFGGVLKCFKFLKKSMCILLTWMSGK